MRRWPPVWVWIGGKKDQSLKGEVGVLKSVRLPLSPLLNRCFLYIEHEGSEYIGCLFIDDERFCRRIYDLLNTNSGRTIEEIGSLDL